MPDLRLTGCTSRPLVGYLKALGVLRVVGQQADRSARGRWRNGVLELRSALDDSDLQTFFLSEYAPSPVLSPWNGRSGFYPKGNATAVKNLERVESANDTRFAPYGALIEQTRTLLGDLDIAEKPEGIDKERLIRRLRQKWPDGSIEWLDAAVVIARSGIEFPPVLGSGGNDGSYDFSSNFMEALAEVLLGVRERSGAFLSAALNDTPTRLEKRGLAHFSRDGSPNNSPYGEADSLGNPWDLTLAVEGSLLLTAGAARRHGTSFQGSLVAPFTVRPTGAGYGSAVEGESGRAELWLPLWNGWASLAEVSTLARESRAQVGGAKRRQAASGLDFARAAGELGVARGITAFERYAILERAGQASLAVPAGRISVEDRDGAKAVGTIDRWLTSLLRFASGDRCPQGPRGAIRQLEQAAFELAAEGNSQQACAALEAMGTVEATLAHSVRAAEAGGVRPLAGVPAEHWIKAADDNSHEFAVALALASLHDARRSPRVTGGRDGRLPALRDYLHGTKWGEKSVEFDPERRHVVAAPTPVGILAAVHARRHLDAARSTAGDPSANGQSGDPTGEHGSQLAYHFGAWASLESARLFAVGQLDDSRILALLHGLSLLDFHDRRRVPVSRPEPRMTPPPPQPAFELLALAWHPVPNRTSDERRKRSGDATSLGARPGWAARLSAGATRSVFEDAMLRLRMAGLPPALTPSDLALPRKEELELGRRLAASLLLHLDPRGIKQLVDAHIPRNEHEDPKTKEHGDDREPQ